MSPTPRRRRRTPGVPDDLVQYLVASRTSLGRYRADIVPALDAVEAVAIVESLIDHLPETITAARATPVEPFLDADADE